VISSLLIQIWMDEDWYFMVLRQFSLESRKGSAVQVKQLIGTGSYGSVCEVG
jgi:hypothetical protein